VQNAKLKGEVEALRKKHGISSLSEVSLDVKRPLQELVEELAKTRELREKQAKVNHDLKEKLNR